MDAGEVVYTWNFWAIFIDCFLSPTSRPIGSIYLFIYLPFPLILAQPHKLRLNIEWLIPPSLSLALLDFSSHKNWWKKLCFLLLWVYYKDVEIRRVIGKDQIFYYDVCLCVSIYININDPPFLAYQITISVAEKA